MELAEEFAVSRERMRQIEVSAFEKVQNAMNQRVAAARHQVKCGCGDGLRRTWLAMPGRDRACNAVPADRD